MTASRANMNLTFRKQQAIVKEKRQRIEHGHKGAIRDLFWGMMTHIHDKCTVIC